MAEIYKDVRKDIKFSEVAVDGLFAGLLAGLVMAAYLGVTTLVRSETPGDLFNRFDPTQAASPMIGFVMHLAVSSVYGILFGLVWYVAARMGRLALRAPQAVALGIGYGAGLFFLAWYVLLPASASPLLQLPTWQFGAAHLVYGAILGWSTQRSIS